MIGVRKQFQFLSVALLLVLLPALVTCVNVWTRSYNNQRTGANLEETILNTNNVKPSTFGKLYSRNVVGHVYAQVLHANNLRMENGEIHNVIFVATMANNVYAFDADDPNQSQPLWVRNFGPTLPISEQAQWFEHSDHCAIYSDIVIEVGILSTPVIDFSTNTMYLTNVNKDADTPYTVRHRLNAIDIRSGKDVLPPVVIDASVPGNGAGSVNGVLTFNPKKQSQRLAMTLVGDNVFFAFGSYCTAPPYHGWVFGYNKRTLQRTFYWCTTPNGEQGSFWHTGQGIVVDGDYLYGVTTNGAYDPSQLNFANSFIKIDPKKQITSGPYKDMLDAMNGGVNDTFTPYNWHDLYVYDMDLGTAGPVMLPGTDVVCCCSKLGWCYCVDKNNFGRLSNQPNTNNNLQYWKANKNSNMNILEWPALTMGTHCSPAVWESANKGLMFYIWPVQDNLKAYKFNRQGRLGQFDLNAELGGDNPAINFPGFPGAAMSISADGNKPGSGILWTSHTLDGSANRGVKTGVLRAFDANDITKELWNSIQVPCRDRIGIFAKFTPPMVSNGKVFMPTFSDPGLTRNTQVHAFGLLPANRLNEQWPEDSCCVIDSCGVNSCCNGACYSPQVYSCCTINRQRVLIPAGQSCPNPGPFEPPNPNPPTPNPPTPNPPPGPQPVTKEVIGTGVRINCGGAAVTDANGNVWKADTAADALRGTISTTTHAIVGVTGASAAIYQSERWQAAGDISFAFSAVAGNTYKISLHFAEFYEGAMTNNARVFSCSVNGRVQFDNIDIFAEAGGYTPLIKNVAWTADSTDLVISCAHKVQNPKISGIEVILTNSDPVPDPSGSSPRPNPSSSGNPETSVPAQASASTNNPLPSDSVEARESNSGNPLISVKVMIVSFALIFFALFYLSDAL